MRSWVDTTALYDLEARSHQTCGSRVESREECVSGGKGCQLIRTFRNSPCATKHVKASTSYCVLRILGHPRFYPGFTVSY